MNVITDVSQNQFPLNNYYYLSLGESYYLNKISMVIFNGFLKGWHFHYGKGAYRFSNF
jgi:hypothetical protein